MLLLRSLHCALAALCIAALVFMLECNATYKIIPVWSDDGASSSSSHPASGSRNAPGSVYRLDSFISRIDLSEGGQRNNALLNSFYRYPFDGDMPIIDIQAGTQAVEEALKQFGNVVLVDSVNQRAKRVEAQQGRIQTHDYAQTANALWLSSIDPEVHTFRHLTRNQANPNHPTRMPDPINTDHLPHIDGEPILTSGDATVGHMAYASNNPSRSFYLYRHGKKPLAIFPDREHYVTQAGGQLGNRLHVHMTKYGTASVKYRSSAMASLLYGKPIPQDGSGRPNGQYVDLIQDRTRSPSRAEMIEALRTHGGFRFYDSHLSSSRPFEVRLRSNPAGAGTHMDISIEPIEPAANSLSVMDRLRRMRI
ncbi:uncharacterized protein SRS1_11239 [Sporisorium reilianum f. sp. reilianum]|uniref:Uncharacterized protein n=1 Tax=Sporisorium reilianum f. sp. reilianum TaxID=72559 RepID=A0A2N8UGV5_9BASI|nr:uncharacterized protein SRS1_11239 [Sporisorium reilianum f. sp. reilianum]